MLGHRTQRKNVSQERDYMEQQTRGPKRKLPNVTLAAMTSVNIYETIRAMRSEEHTSELQSQR